MYHILILFAEPSDLIVSITEIIMNLSVVVQWDEVDDSLNTTYIVTWTSERVSFSHPVLTEQPSYAITNNHHTLDTVYNITVTSGNRCGQGPEFMTNVSFPTGIQKCVSLTLFLALILCT